MGLRDYFAKALVDRPDRGDPDLARMPRGETTQVTEQRRFEV